jgi:hypothetical protein
MRFEVVRERVVLARESKSKYLLPYENFIYKLHSAGALLDFLEEKKASKELQQEARKYYVIICISSMENYFKRTVQIFIEAKWINEDFLSILKQDTISLADLFNMDKNQFRLSEIFIVTHSFQNIESINHILSKMLGIDDVLKNIEKIDVEFDDGSHIILKKDFPDFRNKITELAELRHLIVHHEGYKGILGRERLYNLSRNLINFVNAADEYILEKVPEE